MSSYLFSLVACTIINAVSVTQANATDERDRSRKWLDRPWEIRYLLFVDTAAGSTQKYVAAHEQNVSDGKNGKDYVYRNVHELLTPTATLSISGSKAITASLISFDRLGQVTNHDGPLLGFIAKRSLSDRLVLIPKDTPSAKPYKLLNWSQGIPGNLSFGPSPCTTLDMLRYEDDWIRGGYAGDFGCREWTAQLFNDERPYIDVTTYTKRGNFIGQFVGWSRFKDAPKPVIGMNGKTWLCLHECPAGEKPGIIDNIKAWTSKHHYPMPARPAYQPEYPNKNYKDDLNELWQD